MELQLALYAGTKDILLFFGEVSRTIITKSIVCLVDGIDP